MAVKLAVLLREEGITNSLIEMVQFGTGRNKNI